SLPRSNLNAVWNLPLYTLSWSIPPEATPWANCESVNSNSTPLSFHCDRVPPQFPVNKSWFQRLACGVGAAGAVAGRQVLQVAPIAFVLWCARDTPDLCEGSRKGGCVQRPGIIAVLA